MMIIRTTLINDNNEMRKRETDRKRERERETERLTFISYAECFGTLQNKK